MNVVVGHTGVSGLADCGAEDGIFLEKVESAVQFGLILGVAGGDYGVHVPVAGPAARNQGGHFLFFADLPVDEFLDVRMIGVEDDHFCRAAGGAARFDGAGGAVADFEEAHQARAFSAAGEGFVRAPQVREIRPRPRTEFENARLAHPEVHDPALVHEIVVDRLDEAGVGLGPLVGILGPGHFSRNRVAVVVALGGALDSIGPVEAGVKPLGGVWRGYLAGEHESDLVVEGPGVFPVAEVVVFPSPIGPASRHPVKYMPSVPLHAEPFVLGERG